VICALCTSNPATIVIWGLLYSSGNAISRESLALSGGGPGSCHLCAKSSTLDLRSCLSSVASTSRGPGRTLPFTWSGFPLLGTPPLRTLADGFPGRVRSQSAQPPPPRPVRREFIRKVTLDRRAARRVRSGLVSIWCHSLLGPPARVNTFVVAVMPRGEFNQTFARSWPGACSRRRSGRRAASSIRSPCAGCCG
jgi:hypothetical protein